VLNSRSQAYDRVSGTWPLLKYDSGTYNDINGLVVVPRIYQRTTESVWFISLSLKSLDRSLSIDEAKSEKEAIAKLNDWSKKLKIKIVEPVNI
jgi:hypothetical protein